MYSLRVCTTDDRELPPPSFGVELTWDRLSEALRREVGPDAADLLAEPVHDPARGQTHWHITAEQDPVPLAALAPADRSHVLGRLNTVRDKVAARARQLQAGGEASARLAAALQAIVLVPDEQAHVWSVAGRPVLTAWGRRTAAAARHTATIMTRSATPRPAPPAPAPAPPAPTAIVRTPATTDAAATIGVAAATAPHEPTAPAETGRRAFRVPSSLLWVLFLPLLAAIYYLLLAACALDIPVLRSILDQCRTEARDLDLLRERNDALREAVREAERRLALACTSPPPSTPQPTPTPAPRTPAQQPPAAQPPDTKQAEERVEEAKGRHGKLEITLAWNGHADLDLRVYCPGGRIAYDTPSACRGQLDVDRNAGAPYSDTPVEHVSWADDPPHGHYKVEVMFFNRRDAADGPVPFTVVVRDGDNVKTFHGTLDQPGKAVVVTEFER